MTDKELTKALATTLDVSLETAQKVKKAFILSISSTLEKGEPVVLNGIGSLKVAVREKRAYYNVHTKKMKMCPASKVVRFKISSRLKEALNKKTDSKRGKK